MRCCACGRAIFNTPAAQVKTRDGMASWGPVCARKAGLLPVRMTTTRTIRITSPAQRRAREDENQMQLELTP